LFLELRRRYRYRRHRFQPLGRVRYTSEIGVWDEWYIQWDGALEWLDPFDIKPDKGGGPAS